MTTPAQVLDLQTDLVRRLADPSFRTYIASACQPDAGDTNVNRGENANLDARLGSRIAESLPRVAPLMNAYRVSADMVSLVSHAASLLDDEDVFASHLAPSQFGFVVLDAPLTVTEIRGHTMHIDVLLWLPAMIEHEGTPGTLVVAFNDTDRPDEVTRLLYDDFDESKRASVARILGRWGFTSLTFAVDGAGVGPPTYEATERAKAYLAEHDASFGTSTNIERYLHALWLLMGQTIATVSTQAPERHAVKRAKRARLLNHDAITVIELRRPKNVPEREPSQSHREYTRQWLVQGGWAWRACGPNWSQRRRVWIHDYVKGPKDKPLVISRKVRDLKR